MTNGTHSCSVGLILQEQFLDVPPEKQQHRNIDIRGYFNENGLAFNPSSDK